VEKQDALVVAFKSDHVSGTARASQPARAFIAQQEKSKLPAATIAAK
jgi:hypothetical protein